MLKVGKKMENKFVEQTAASCLAALLTSPVANRYTTEQIASVAVAAARALEKELAKPPFEPPTQVDTGLLQP